MKKQNPLILSIQNPCNENWAEMSIVDKGRFCSHCQAVVKDLTVLSDAAIVRLFEQEPDTHCIRAFASQLDRPLSLPVQSPTRFYRIAVALGLSIMMAGAADAYARPKAPLSEQNYLLNESRNNNSGDDSLKIWGIVMNKSGVVMDDVVVHLRKNGMIRQALMTDEEGRFELKVDSAGTYQMDFTRKGFVVRTINVSTDNPGIKKGLTIRLEPMSSREPIHQQIMSGPPPIPNRRAEK